jgi:hypothetical protein
MLTRHIVGGLIASAFFCLPRPLLAAIRLTPVVSIGLSNPVFVGNTRDGSDPLFSVEQTGVIKVLHSVAPYSGRPKNRNGTMTIAGSTFSVKQSK